MLSQLAPHATRQSNECSAGKWGFCVCAKNSRKNFVGNAVAQRDEVRARARAHIANFKIEIGRRR